MYHIFLIQYPVDGHLDCFHVLVIVISASLNIRVHVSFQTVFYFECMPGVGLLGHMAALFLVFQGTFILFSIVATPIYIPSNSVGGFSSLHTLSRIYCLWIYFALGIKIATRKRRKMIVVIMCWAPNYALYIQ